MQRDPRWAPIVGVYMHCKRAHCVKGLVHTDHCLSIVSLPRLCTIVCLTLFLYTHTILSTFVRTRSLGFLSFAHQEGDLGFVELRLALSGSAASVTVEPTRFLLTTTSLRKDRLTLSSAGRTFVAGVSIVLCNGAHCHGTVHNRVRQSSKGDAGLWKGSKTHCC